MRYEIHIIPENLIKFRVRNDEANVSGQRPESMIRTSWEFAHILKNYLKVNSVDILLKVFPEAAEYKDIDSDSIPLAANFGFRYIDFIGLTGRCDLYGIENICNGLESVHGLHDWKLLVCYYKLRDKIFPPDTRRRAYAESVKKAIKGIMFR